MKTLLRHMIFVIAVSLTGFEYAEAAGSVTQEIVQDKGELVYIVNDRARSLSMVARELYGDRRWYSKIAEWNGLDKEAKLKYGQRLKLKETPTQSLTDANATLIKWWGILGNSDMVARLGGAAATASLPAKAAVVAPTPAVPVEAKPNTKTTSKTNTTTTTTTVVTTTTTTTTTSVSKSSKHSTSSPNAQSTAAAAPAASAKSAPPSIAAPSAPAAPAATSGVSSSTAMSSSAPAPAAAPAMLTPVRAPSSFNEGSSESQRENHWLDESVIRRFEEITKKLYDTPSSK